MRSPAPASRWTTVRVPAERNGALLVGKRSRKAGGLVYSTDPEAYRKSGICAGCRHPMAECVCRDRSRPREGTDRITVSRETRGRKGAGVTLIRGLPLSDQDLDKLAKRLKATCGVGGAVKDGVIELQGEQRDRVVELLASEGFPAKKSGG